MTDVIAEFLIGLRLAVAVGLVIGLNPSVARLVG